MTAFEILKREHRLIKQFMAVLGSMLDRIDNGELPIMADLKLAEQFIREYADQFHHAKEEKILFKAIKSLPLDDELDQIASLEMEHFLNRSFCDGMAEALVYIEAGRPDGMVAFTENARACIALVIQHICKEDHQLFPWCEEHLDQEVTALFVRQFEEMAAVEFEAKFDQLWIDRVAALKESYGESAEVIAACH